MTKLKTPKLPNPHARKIPLPCRVNSDEMRKILAMAQKYTGGNVSEFVRYAVLNFKTDGKK
jgi:hypothetical protein